MSIAAHQELRDWPDPAAVVGGAVRITLVYRGPLPACQNDNRKSDHKHRIRVEFSSQLAWHWQNDPLLATHAGGIGFPLAQVENRHVQIQQDLISKHAFYCADTCGYRAVPLITRHNGLTCWLDITLKRRSDPGDLIVNGTDGGDLDNRLKLLLDALRMPLANNEVPASMWGHGEWLNCLLEDDALISRIAIEAQRLTTSPAENEGPDYAEVDVVVDVKSLRPWPVTIGIDLGLDSILSLG